VRLQVHAASGDDLLDKTLVISGPSEFRRRNPLVRVLGFLLKAGTLGLIRRNPWKRTRPETTLQVPIRYDAAYGGEANRRFDLKSILPRLLVAAVSTPAMPQRLLKIAWTSAVA